jgi:hypothetical protein
MFGYMVLDIIPFVKLGHHLRKKINLHLLCNISSSGSSLALAFH